MHLFDLYMDKLNRKRTIVEPRYIKALEAISSKSPTIQCKFATNTCYTALITFTYILWLIGNNKNAKVHRF